MIETKFGINVYHGIKQIKVQPLADKDWEVAAPNPLKALKGE